MRRLRLEFATAIIGNKFPTWEEILVIAVVNLLLVIGAIYLFRRSIGPSSRGSRPMAAPPPRSTQIDGRRPAVPRDHDEAEADQGHE